MLCLLLFVSNFVRIMYTGDYYVIVQTTEAGIPMLSVVPHQWVQGNVLLWPSKNASILCQDVTSKPAASWTKLPCVIKRKYIPTYKAAEQEAADLSGMSTDVSDYAPRKKPKKNPKKHCAQPQSQLVEQHFFQSNSGRQSTVIPPACTSQPWEIHSIQPVQTHPLQSVQQSQISLQATNQNNIVEQTTVENIIPEEYVLNIAQPQLDCEKITQDISKKIEEECKKSKMEIIDTIESMLTRTVAALKSDFDVKMAAAFRQRSSQGYGENENFLFSPVASIEAIKELERDLTDETFVHKFMIFMQKVIGHTGDNCNGQNTCYALVDQFFDRRVMLNCSWSGGSKSNVPKFAIKDCKNILDVFFRIVHNVNPTFSKKLLEDFFKQVLRNSKTRSQAKGLRQSTIHRRVKRMAKICNQGTNNCEEAILTEVLKIEGQANATEETDDNPIDACEDEDADRDTDEDDGTDDDSDENDEVGDYHEIENDENVSTTV